MRLTKEQRDAVECDSSVFLTACPGSGKTRVITVKLGRCLEEVEPTPRSVACITYTNAAVHEIETRVRKSLGIRNEWALDISTIHSFCLNNYFSTILAPTSLLSPRIQSHRARQRRVRKSCRRDAICVWQTCYWTRHRRIQSTPNYHGGSYCRPSHCIW